MSEYHTDMATLFATDPLKLESGEWHNAYVAKTGHRPIEDIITWYRGARAAFNLGEKSAGSTKKAKAPALPKGEKLDSLDLDALLGKQQ